MHVLGLGNVNAAVHDFSYLACHSQKQKLQQGSGTNAEPPAGQQVAKVIRHFPQNQPVADNEGQAKPRLSKAILGGVSVRVLADINFMYHDVVIQLLP